MKIKLSDYVADFLAKRGVSCAFVLTGGCAVHIIDSIAKNENIQYMPVQHEQAGAMAADAYARISGRMGVAVVTSGPGATNLLTGVCCSYYDSIPVLMITGQVPATQLKRNSSSRQIGFQETDVVSIFESITKYAKLIDDPNTIRYELEKAFFIAFDGRPGPVLLDICDDVQRAMIDPDELISFFPEKLLVNRNQLTSQINQLVQMLNQASRPVIIIGGGVRLANIIPKVSEFLTKIKIPYSLTWGALDCMSHDDPLFVGGFGVTSGRPGNFAVANADLIVAIGTRLDTHEAGPNLKNFARGAKKVTIDIDPAEQEKYAERGMVVDLMITEDVRNVIDELLIQVSNIKTSVQDAWIERISDWKERYPICIDDYRNQSELINPYFFMECLNKFAQANAVVVTDCGSNLIWTMQGFKAKDSQRIISAFNHSPMGYALPASIGAYVADPNREIICITGDGGMQINIQELATIFRHNINIKIFVMNNHGHGIIQGTQNNWLDGRHHASSIDVGGLPDPDFNKIAEAYGIPSVSISENTALEGVLKEILSHNGAILCNVHMLQQPQIYPKLLYGRPIEDSDPLLPRDEFNKNMIVAPVS